jgi:hypothetical protein
VPSRGGGGRLAFGVPRQGVPRVIIACIALAAISIQLIPLDYHWTGSVSSRSTGTPVELGTQPQLCAALRRPDGIFRISGEVTARTLSNYPNVFATASPLLGVRMEIAPVGTVAAVFYSRSLGSVGVGGDGLVHAGETWSFSLDIRHGGVIALNVANMSMTETLKQLVLTCRSVLVGGGFDSSRQLDGVVHRIVFQTGTVTPRVPGQPLWGAAGVLLLLWLLAGTIGGRSRPPEGGDEVGSD